MLGGELAVSRVQAHWDLTLHGGDKVQVKYLANPASGWVNEHTVHAHPEVAYYALVLFEAFTVTGVLVLPIAQLSAVHAELGKRHSRGEGELQLTRRNWQTILDDPERFRAHGVRIWPP
ncbi:hypothetical protein Acy02nite_47040 [Actinoplanes cyaneus]|uniref:Uncharacterized protein n=1 Tax=Actinoplanes cyaneus TaxID=52696 RepID=A0A919INW4_9ACTN|nr:hypothetical protein [Actinoplanes cyaneus]MCW2138841.1 hypothetical protein [Actinoplanes cyaneus]GID66823.1 hypothetical protein Acy02nite_47040 [Actinoplanes cyaneus]